MVKFYNELVHFLNFGAQKIFSGKSGSFTHNFIWVSSTMPKLWKKVDTILKNAQTGGGRMDRQTSFCRSLQATAGGSKKVILKILQNSQENTWNLLINLFFNSSFSKKRLQHSYFPVSFVNFCTEPFL